MQNTFPLFSRLPIELRFLIWEYASELTEWSILKPRLYRGGISLRGRQATSLDPTSEEALRVIQFKHTYIPGLGWLNLRRSLIFFRDFDATPCLKHIATHGQVFLGRLHHVVLNPRDWARLFESIEVLRDGCPLLQTLVVVAPWFVPKDTTEYDPYTDWLSPYENWSALFKRSPEEVNTIELLDAIEDGIEANRVWLADYHRLLDQAVERLPQPLPSWARPVDNTYWRTQYGLLKLLKALLKFQNRKPNLYLRTVEQLHQTVHPRRLRHSERLARTTGIENR